MIKLYIRTHCPFCQRVMQKAEELGLKVGEDIEYIQADPGTPGREEILQKGGKPQVPFMLEGETAMYESSDIIKHLESKFPKNE